MKTQTTNQKYVMFTLLITLIALGTQWGSYEAQTVDEPFAVKLIYLLPNDQPYDANIPQKMIDAVSEIQTFFGEQMEAHGFGKKTFRIETDADGEPKVHRIDGQYPLSRYVSRGLYFKEIDMKFDRHRDLYIIHIPNQSIEGVAGVGGKRGTGGYAWVMGMLDLVTLTHEVGHAFGLFHDFSDPASIMSYGPGQNKLSACDARYLDVHPYFNTETPLKREHPTTIKLLSSLEYLSGSDSTSIQLKLSDLEGLHQVFLLSDHGNGLIRNFIACHNFEGEEDATFEFNFKGFYVGHEQYLSISELSEHRCRIRAVDIYGNVADTYFILKEVEQLTVPPPLPSLSVSVSTHFAGTLRGHSQKVTSVSFAPDGTLASGSEDNTVMLWDVSTQQSIDTFAEHTGPVTSVAFSRDGTILATGSEDGTAILWDVATGTNIKTFVEHTDRVTSLAFSPDGTTLATSSLDKRINLWNIVTKEKIHTFRSKAWVHSVAFSPDSKTIAFEGKGFSVTLWNIATGKEIGTSPGDYGVVTSIAFSPDGRTLAYGIRNRKVILYDVTTGKDIYAFSDHQTWVNSVAFSPEGFLASASQNQVRLWDIVTLQEITMLPEPQSDVNTIAFSHDGKTLAAGTKSGWVYLWEITTRLTPQLIGDLNDDGVVNILDLVLVASAFGQTGETAADINGDGTVNILDLVMVANSFGSGATAPSAKTLHASHVQHWLKLAEREVGGNSDPRLSRFGDRSYRKGIEVLEQLLASLIPKSSALLPNYPNPFNPETWIPYRLAKSADVQISIYDARGSIVRQLDMGHQSVGMYQTRARAAYWNGKNDVGESVASGVYFYTLTADDFSATRKILILK